MEYEVLVNTERNLKFLISSNGFTVRTYAIEEKSVLFVVSLAEREKGTFPEEKSVQAVGQNVLRYNNVTSNKTI